MVLSVHDERHARDVLRIIQWNLGSNNSSRTRSAVFLDLKMITDALVNPIAEIMLTISSLLLSSAAMGIEVKFCELSNTNLVTEGLIFKFNPMTSLRDTAAV